MSLSTTTINRPVLAIVLSLVIVLLGSISFTYLGLREYPAVDPPRVTVTTEYTGANADVIESQITQPLEESISGIAGIRTLSSTSREGRSTVTVEFDLAMELEQAANDVRDKVSGAMRNLPPDADPPSVSKADADASPLLFFNIRSEVRDFLELTEIAEQTFKEQVQTIPGVSQVWLWGSKRYAMRLWLDPARLAAHNITPLDVRQALQRENVELPSGRIEGQQTELTIRTLSRLETEEDFNSLVLRKQPDGRLVRLADVGRAELGPENERTVLRRDGRPMVGVTLVPQPGANHIDIVDEFYKRIEQIKKDLPPDLELGVGFDNTVHIRNSISEVKQTIFIAFFLVISIIFLFLRNWRTTLIPVLTIPIALIGAFFIMYIADFSINVLTLLAIVLAIGLVVDDAIIVLENVYAKIEQGDPPVEASHKGISELFLAIVSTTTALVAIFLPIVFLQGLTGRLFTEFGVVLAGAVVISSFVALTLTPMLCSRLLTRKGQKTGFYLATEPFFQKMQQGYQQILDQFLAHRWVAFLIMGLAAMLIYGTYKLLPSELAPVEDRSNLRIFANGPEGATFEYMDHYMTQLNQLVEDSIPEKEAIISVTSPGFGASSSVNSGFMRVRLVSQDQRKRSQQEIYNQLANLVQQVPHAQAFVSEEQTIGGSFRSFPVQYVLLAPNLDKLKKVIPEFMDAVRQHPTFRFVDVNLKFNKPELEVEIHRDKAGQLGLSAADIAQTIQAGLSGQRFGFFIKNGRQYQVIGQLPRTSRDAPLDLRSLYVRNDRDELIQLDNVVTIRETSSPPQLFRFDRYVSATISAGLNPGYRMGDGLEAMDEIAAHTLDESFRTALDGPSKDFVESASSLEFAFMLALALVYLVLAAQFESFRAPFIIMFTVPLAMAGALLTLWYFGQTLNIFSQIGVIMLIGLITKNGILVVEFANQRRMAGQNVDAAIREAAAARFRPIIMTALSTIFSVLPLALALGAGAESRMSMGIAVIGGLLFATILSLLVIPAVYTYFAGNQR